MIDTTGRESLIVDYDEKSVTRTNARTSTITGIIWVWSACELFTPVGNATDARVE